MSERVMEEWEEFKLLIAALEAEPSKESLIARIVKDNGLDAIMAQLRCALEDLQKDADMFIK